VERSRPRLRLCLSDHQMTRSPDHAIFVTPCPTRSSPENKDLTPLIPGDAPAFPITRCPDHPMSRSPDVPITRCPDHPMSRSPDHQITRSPYLRPIHRYPPTRIPKGLRNSSQGTCFGSQHREFATPVWHRHSCRCLPLRPLRPSAVNGFFRSRAIASIPYYQLDNNRVVKPPPPPGGGRLLQTDGLLHSTQRSPNC